MRIRLGVCSQSLAVDDVGTLVSLLRRTGVGGLHLALDPIREGRIGLAELRDALAGSPATILSGMMALGAGDVIEDLGPGALVPDVIWFDTLKAAEHNARQAADLGLPLVTLRAVPRPPANGPAGLKALASRIHRIAAPFTGRDIGVALEAGREDADTTIGLLIEIDTETIGVSFDPGEMILHGAGDPVEALDLLAPYVKQIRIRDAVAPAVSGMRGDEVAVGHGSVDWDALFDVVRNRGLTVPMVIARETGEDRLRDIKAAAALVRACGMEGIGSEHPAPT